MGTLFPTLVYLLCFATSAACAALLARSYFRTRTAMLMWSALCFVLLACNNFLVILDLLVFPDADFRAWRSLTALAAVGVLLFGFIWDSSED
jgi:hypothetical protein